MKEIIDNYIENAFVVKEQAEFKFSQFSYNYKKYFPQNMNANMLDIGIGKGEMLTCMKQWGYENYIGIDISASAVNYCNSIGLNCELVEDTVNWVENKKNRFDIVAMLDVLEHIGKNDVVPLLRAVNESLKENGKLIIQVPNMQAPESQLYRYEDFTHETGFTENSLRQVIVAAGFTDFIFQGYEVIFLCKFSSRKKRFFRGIYWWVIRKLRRINTNLNPKILNPVFFAVATKT
jgi:2-polyprenyl-3-methyl-5-hydroxy-6-metoxy-1,4-benzoquinol methylase